MTSAWLRFDRLIHAYAFVVCSTEWPSVPYFSFAVISVGGAAISFLLKETHGMALQDEVKAGEDDSIQPSQTDATPGDDQRISTIAFDNNNSADKMENGSAAPGI